MPYSWDDDPISSSSRPPLPNPRSHFGTNSTTSTTTSTTPTTSTSSSRGAVGGGGGHPHRGYPSPSYPSSAHVRYWPPGLPHMPHAPVCPGFPYHTSAAVYLSNLAITGLAVLALLTGLESIPGSSPSRSRRLSIVIVGSLAGSFLLLHLLSFTGLLDGLLATLGVTVVACLAGGAPVLLLPEFKEILHHTTQPWLLSPHALRVLHFLLLPLFDSNLLPLAFAGPAGWGGLLVGFTAPVVALAFGAHRKIARGLGIVWIAVGVVELLCVLILEAVFIPPYVQSREDHRLDTQYIWHTVAPLVHFTVPMLLVLHGWSLWKLAIERNPRPTMLWQEEDDADLAAIYGPDSPGTQSAHTGGFDAVMEEGHPGGGLAIKGAEAQPLNGS